MASPGSPCELHPEPDPDVHGSQFHLSSFADLRGVPGTELRKLTDIAIIAAESNGELYAPIFRQLQIRADKYQDFHSGVIRILRNKHHKIIQRGTDASVRDMTDFLLQGFGYIIWKADSDWVLDETDLDEGEAKLIYVKGRNNVPDSRFYPILEPLWRQMRNVMFTRRGHGTARRPRFPSVAPTDGEESYLGDVDSRPSSPVAAAHARARARATTKLDNLAAQIARIVPRSKPNMSSEGTEDAIIDLIARLAEIRANSDPRTFEELWQTHVIRVEELDNGQATHDDEPEESNTVGLAAATEKHLGEHRASQSNVPFMTEGGPVLPRSLVSRGLIPPSLPSIMSVYISVSRLPTRGQGHLNSISHTAAAPLAQAYHWPSAPVEEHNMAAFFTGICYRVDVSPSAVLAEGEGGGDDLANSSNQCQTGGADDGDSSDCEMTDAMSDLPGSAKPTLAESSSPPSPTLERGLDDFTEEDWRVTALGWRDFQHDLRHAARTGTRVWRMKVCVVTAAATS
ncbi:uncharacterized protein Z520_07894 [Fonsecaea multimorphosa CBS 102226]|uniref:Uncharacterized protein n=1 Tax=Fonsecaea multimorphosa CBS 102226 TaxID=1442371 RepID=A0A0D2KJ39_9EURO|nr:uncharacterized protein Z520_07894 [Fonsecaea multimorphosa CBS 102226]KIX96628.1 hypothetical protein Z520_07894 [Fonsecaea multimorphosa CBS 102226]OAL17499.1 hypothetical protein AYO22_11631 [Fonsecaea multimorphosa]